MAGSILVVEDDGALARTMTRNLHARGYTARAASTVAEAAALAAEERPTLILLDIDLPDGSGWDILRTLSVSGSPVAAIAMSALRPNERLCREFAVVGSLEKPFPMEALLRLVARYADGARGEASSRQEGEAGLAPAEG